MGKRNKRKTRKEMRQENKSMNNSKKTTVAKTNYTPTPPCHKGQNLVFKTPSGIEVYGGGKNRSGGWDKLPFIPDLAMGPSETLTGFSYLMDKTTVPEGWHCENFAGTRDPPPTISLDFPDFGIPKVGVDFWYALVQDIEQHEVITISTQCAGGHGRTGVQLCILYQLLHTEHPYYDTAGLIKMIRDMHCHHAVETQEQQEYIAEVCGLPVGENVIVDRWNTYGGGGLGKGHTSHTSDDKWKDILDEKWDTFDWDSEYEPEVKIDAKEKCSACGEVSYFFDTLDHCEKCDALYGSQPKPACPSCDSQDGLVDDGKSCDTCSWHEPDKKGEKRLCFSCGSSKLVSDFTLNTDDYCIQCYASMGRIKHDEFGVECFECKKVKDNQFILDYSKKDKGFVCRKCFS